MAGLAVSRGTVTVGDRIGGPGVDDAHALPKLSIHKQQGD
jgi:hypothetical protein